VLADEGKDVLKEIKGGQDGLSVIVQKVSKKSKRVDKGLHVCNGIGLACADRHRVKLLLINVLLGIAVFFTAVCGALGLSDFAIKVLPWATYTDVPFYIASMYWWGCRPRGERHFFETASANVTRFREIMPACVAEMTARNNTAFWTGIQSAMCAHTSRMLGSSGSKNATTQPQYGAYTDMSHSDACVEFLFTPAAMYLPIGRVDWKLNQWGFCVFPSADGVLPNNTYDALHIRAAPTF
jgi:hypothetical protein